MALVTRRELLQSFVLTSGSLLLGACQPAALPSSVPAPTAVSRATPRPGPARAGSRFGGSLTWGTVEGLGEIDPHQPSWWISVPPWADLVYQSLVGFDEGLRVVPALAESWDATDPASWRFNIRQGVRFHDGSELEADDVLFWFDRVKATESRDSVTRWTSVIESVETVGRYAVQIRLSEPYAPLLPSLAGLRCSAIVSRRWATSANLRREAVGTGPFRLAELTPGRRARLVRHGDYWEQPLPYLDEISLETIVSSESAVAGLRVAGLGGARVEPSSARQVTGLNDTRTLSARGAALLAHQINTQRKPLDDVRVRRALGLAIDRRAAVEKVADGRARPSGPVPTGHGPWYIRPDALPYRRDLARARQLLTEAGYADGLELSVTSAEQGDELALSLLLSDQLREIGIQASVRAVAGDLIEPTIAKGEFDLAARSIRFLPDPHAYLSEIYRTDGLNNVSGWSNSRFDELVDTARTTMDPNHRRSLYEEAQSILLNEVPTLWWYAEEQVEVVRLRVSGYVQSFTGRPSGLKHAWLER